AANSNPVTWCFSTPCAGPSATWASTLAMANSSMHRAPAPKFAWKTCTCPTGNNASTAPAGWWTRNTTLRFPPSKRQRRATEGEAASAPRRGVLPLLRRQVGAAAVGHFRRHAQALAERRVRMDGLADVDGVGPH